MGHASRANKEKARCDDWANSFGEHLRHSRCSDAAHCAAADAKLPCDPIDAPSCARSSRTLRSTSGLMRDRPNGRPIFVPGHPKASRAIWLDQVHELALRFAVALDVTLRRGEAGMASELLDIA